ncbi:hypothetical protein DSM106972_052700 [Dulcicalothrix desertica PCC 7102]|uniref:Uncharacterized protein n=1 Tax=Dulcicalothrix desertica PCC 7102 TaxID=232991 RepID=A0A433VBZ3_9CYAN|nr:hypothetical protein [Dulcicalothrix desertica]RUT03631.1 hypothetical protein DSM106972_052700 [Dulcicalothrix desertica PCC 7102]TWH43929.1 hypothetical protein CAL7102_07681 [Dulcicalothrix desertica PCC 7102]
MSIKLTFWLVLALWILKILQPGYLQFYGWRHVVTLAQKLQSSPITVPTPSPSSTPTAVTDQTSSVKECPKPNNDFEKVLSSASVGCWRASDARN